VPAPHPHRLRRPAVESLREAVRTPSEGEFHATADIVDDEMYQHLTAVQLRDLLSKPFDGSFFFVADDE
jgi:hypothetical protein